MCLGKGVAVVAFVAAATFLMYHNYHTSGEWDTPVILYIVAAWIAL